MNEDTILSLLVEGGRAVEALQDRTGAALSVRTDGEVQIYAPDAGAMSAALRGVKAAEGTDLERGVVYLAR